MAGGSNEKVILNVQLCDVYSSNIWPIDKIQLSNSSLASVVPKDFTMSTPSHTEIYTVAY